MGRRLRWGLVGVTGLFALADTATAASGGTAGLPTAFTTGRFLMHWWVFPTSIAFATVAIASGVSGALVHALTATPAWYIVTWSVLGVLVGSTIGSRVGKHVCIRRLWRNRQPTT
jgi:uncharacterized membrane protein YfcA